MRHRTYAGKIVYLTDGAGEMGRERFRVTVHDDGRRTLRAICEMDDDELLRDVTHTVDRHFRPLDAFVRLRRADADPDRPPVEVWAYSDDFIPARLRWDLLGQTYELVELDHTRA